MLFPLPWNYKHCVQLEPGGGCHNNHEKAKNNSLVLYCLRWNYDMLCCFRAGSPLSCGNCLQTFFKKAIFVECTWIAGANYLPDHRTVVLTCFSVFLRICLRTVCTNFSIMLKLKNKSNDPLRAHFCTPCQDMKIRTVVTVSLIRSPMTGIKLFAVGCPREGGPCVPSSRQHGRLPTSLPSPAV